MKNNETGEYELVVGNPQLLSGFFIVVLLCGVAFAMGYVVGQNSPHSARTAAAQAGAPAAVDANPPAVSSAPAQAPPAAAPAVQTAENPAQPPAADAAKPAEPSPQPTTQAARETPPAPAAQAPAPAPDAPPGSYWQVTALSQAAAAQPIAQNLKDGGMPVGLRQGPDGLTHVLVGPYFDTQSLSKARTVLEKRFGIRNPTRK